MQWQLAKVVALGLWWFMNEEWNLRELSGQRWKDWLLVLSVFIWSVASYRMAIWGTSNIGLRFLIYYAVAGGAVFLACLEEIRWGWKLATQANTICSASQDDSEILPFKDAKHNCPSVFSYRACKIPCE